MSRLWLAIALVLVACSSSAEDRRRCEAIAEDIRAAAQARGLPIQGVCNNPNAPEFASACAALRKCNDELD